MAFWAALQHTAHYYSGHSVKSNFSGTSHNRPMVMAAGGAATDQETTVSRGSLGPRGDHP